MPCVLFPILIRKAMMGLNIYPKNKKVGFLFDIGTPSIFIRFSTFWSLSLGRCFARIFSLSSNLQSQSFSARAKVPKSQRFQRKTN
jgi:hypothetical protein